MSGRTRTGCALIAALLLTGQGTAMAATVGALNSLYHEAPYALMRTLISDMRMEPQQVQGAMAGGASAAGGQLPWLGEWAVPLAFWTMAAGAALLLLILGARAFGIAHTSYGVPPPSATGVLIGSDAKASLLESQAAQDQERDRFLSGFQKGLDDLLADVDRGAGELRMVWSGSSTSIMQRAGIAGTELDLMQGDLRFMGRQLAGATLLRAGLTAALHQVKEAMAFADGRSVELRSNLGSTRFDRRIEVSVLRAVQRLFANTNARNLPDALALSVVRSGLQTRLAVEHHGGGLRGGPQGAASHALRALVAGAHGVVRISSGPDGSTHVAIEFPII